VKIPQTRAGQRRIAAVGVFTNCAKKQLGNKLHVLSKMMEGRSAKLADPSKALNRRCF